MKHLLLTVLCLSVSILLHSQEVSLDLLDKKSRKTYSKALKCFEKGEQLEGIAKLEEVTSKYPGFKPATQKLAGIYLDNSENEKAISLLQTMMDNTDVVDPRLAMSISYPMEEKGDYDNAISILKQLESAGQLKEKQAKTVSKRIKELEFRKVAYANPHPFQPQPVSRQVNSNDLEYHPAFNADGSLMLFVRTTQNRPQEDLYYSRKITSDSFSIAEPIKSINTPNNEGAFTLSQDGKTMIFTACDWRGSYGGCDLYISFNSGNKWSDPKNMGPVINSEYWESSPALSTDGRNLYFSSKRPGGHGGADLWMVALNDQNQWGEVVNLGPTINTEGNEETPFLHPDNKTLYFISNGLIGLGSYDLFVTKQTDNHEWGTPENLGYPINTPQREGGLFVDLAGEKAYYSAQLDFSDEDNNVRKGDIYSFDLPKVHKPELVTYVKVIVRDAETNGLINANAQLINLDAKQTSSNITTKVSGTLLTTINPGEYALNISRDNYVFHSENIMLEAGAAISDPFLFEVSLRPIEPEKELPPAVESAPIVLNNIFFETGSAQLLSQSNLEINSLTSLLQKNENLKIKIVGHTDNVGNDNDNFTLSRERAEAVYDRLVDAGIAKSRLAFEGKGETMPIADNATNAGRQKNRRTEFVVIR